MVNRCYVDGPSVITEVHQDGGGAGVVLNEDGHYKLAVHVRNEDSANAWYFCASACTQEELARTTRYLTTTTCLQCPTAPPNAGTVTAPKSIPTAYPDSLSPPKDGEVNATMPQNIRPSVMFEVSTLACLLLLAVGVVASVCYFQRLKKKLLNKDPAAAPFVQAQNIAFRCWPPRSWPVSFHTDGSDAILRRNAEMHCSR
ncbi:hypothetical protein BV898_19252 [Hypsibius exemplaris]|nr:hypothetical protein BV898_19252 [Hypsibius exemplaris]